MNTSNLKTDIMEYLNKSDDENLLSDIARLIKVNDNYNHIEFSEVQKETVLKAIKEYEEGTCLTDKVAENDIQKWLKD